MSVVVVSCQAESTRCRLLRMCVCVCGLPLCRMAMILKKLGELMAAEGMEVASFPPCEELQISLLK